MAEGDLELRRQLEALQAGNKALAVDAELEQSPDLELRRAELKAAATAMQGAVAPLELDVPVLQRELVTAQAAAAALEDSHRRREHESISLLAFPVVLGGPVLLGWAVFNFGVPPTYAVFLAGFALPALWLPRLFRLRAPPPGALLARVTGVGVLSVFAAATAGWRFFQAWSAQGATATELGASALLSVACVLLATFDRARRPAPRGLSVLGMGRAVAMVILALTTLVLQVDADFRAWPPGLHHVALAALGLCGLATALEGKLRRRLGTADAPG